VAYYLNFMSRYFRKLPGYQRTQSGYEWGLFKKIPRIFFGGLLMLAVVFLYLYLFCDPTNPETGKLMYLCLGLLFSHCFFVGTITIGCIVVMIMKGPAYVADPYELPKENPLKEPFN